jgi:hypothetical protein
MNIREIWYLRMLWARVEALSFSLRLDSYHDHFTWRLTYVFYCCAHACLEPSLIPINSSCTAVVTRVWREKEKQKGTNCRGHQVYREVGAYVIIAALCIFFLMCYSVQSSPQLLSDSTLLLLQFMYTSVIARIYTVYCHVIDLFI